MNETLTKCAEEFFREYAQTAEYLEKYDEFAKNENGTKENCETIDEFLHQLRENEGFKKFNDVDVAISSRNCEFEKFGFINGFLFAAQLLSK